MKKKSTLLLLSLILILSLFNGLKFSKKKENTNKILIYKLGNRTIVEPEFLNLPPEEREALILSYK